jgi:hypothetical protein
VCVIYAVFRSHFWHIEKERKRDKGGSN